MLRLLLITTIVINLIFAAGALQRKDRFWKNGEITVQQCADCFPGGFCVKDKDTLQRTCLCNFGWTGKRAEYAVHKNGSVILALNRILADDCKLPCHYTPYHRNEECVKTPPVTPMVSTPAPPTPLTPNTVRPCCPDNTPPPPPGPIN